ncbi:hypothetical protein ZIOFF_067774 [Zingiber officinale]|uniref:Uncharacterized protein n=1 Tax=Zingiber officinale TaxID=94328 RepID=A0A8J5CG59_ZINOF|nr:hypothetical protein ZIOFF_067774 [Zingiber officinale]
MFASLLSLQGTPVPPTRCSQTPSEESDSDEQPLSQRTRRRPMGLVLASESSTIVSSSRPATTSVPDPQLPSDLVRPPRTKAGAERGKALVVKEEIDPGWKYRSSAPWGLCRYPAAHSRSILLRSRLATQWEHTMKAMDTSSLPSLVDLSSEMATMVSFRFLLRLSPPILDFCSHYVIMNRWLRRTGKSCRLRWLNYLRPDVRRGNITLEEQLLILELHSRLGNRWSKIARHLPGRTDNEIKNYWRTRVQKHARQMRCDVDSKQFEDMVRAVWMPRLAERIHEQKKPPRSLESSCSYSESVETQLSPPLQLPTPATAPESFVSDVGGGWMELEQGESMWSVEDIIWLQQQL